MLEPVIFDSEYGVDARLSAFDVTHKELRNVALAAIAARNNATRLHPINSPGTFSYHEGVAALRLLFLPKKGWKIARPNGIEMVENQSLGLMIIFQNVDHACGLQDPKPVSGKGEGSKKFIDNPSGYLWEYMEKEDNADENKHAWFLCISVNGDKVRAELSRPKSIDGSQFGLFLERIFIISEDWNPLEDLSDEEPFKVEDFEINVSKKS